MCAARLLHLRHVFDITWDNECETTSNHSPFVKLHTKIDDDDDDDGDDGEDDDHNDGFSITVWREKKEIYVKKTTNNENINK